MMSRLIPFSLLTCSMTRFRSGNIRPPVPSSGVRPPGGASEIVLDVGLLDGHERKHDAADVRIMDRHALGIHRLERPVEHPAVTDRIMGANPYPLPERATEVRLAQQGPVDARRRTLELVATRDRVVRVEHVAELTGHASQLLDDRSIALRYDLVFDLEARRELTALRREITREDAEVLDRLERGELAVDLPHLALDQRPHLRVPREGLRTDVLDAARLRPARKLLLVEGDQGDGVLAIVADDHRLAHVRLHLQEVL